jgi:hypothetical protein
MVALSDSIHRFHLGPSRELFSKYEDANLERAVAHAIHRGVVPAEEAGADVLALLGKYLDFPRYISRFMRQREVAGMGRRRPGRLGGRRAAVYPLYWFSLLRHPRRSTPWVVNVRLQAVTSFMFCDSSSRLGAPR